METQQGATTSRQVCLSVCVHAIYVHVAVLHGRVSARDKDAPPSPSPAACLCAGCLCVCPLAETGRRGQAMPALCACACSTGAAGASGLFLCEFGCCSAKAILAYICTSHSVVQIPPGRYHGRRGPAIEVLQFASHFHGAGGCYATVPSVVAALGSLSCAHGWWVVVRGTFLVSFSSGAGVCPVESAWPPIGT